MSHKTYLITAAVAGANPNKGFLTCLTAYAKRLGAKVLVAQLPGVKKADEIAPSIATDFDTTLVGGTVALNRNLSLLRFRIRPAAANPLLGLQRVIRNVSAVIPHTKQFFQSVATLNSEPRVFYSTGVCTEAYYGDNFAGDRAALDHVVGAVVVEVSANGLFHARHIRWKQGNGFTDLGLRTELFGRGGVRFVPVRAEAVIPGDWHTGDVDETARAATFAMFHEFEPRQIVLHDIMNGHSINHHERNKCITRSREHKNGRLSLPVELAQVADELAVISKQTPKDCKVNVAKSNHDDWLARYLEEGLFTGDPQNTRLCLDLAAALADGKDPLEVAVRRSASLPKVTFLTRKTAIRPLGWDIGQHGDAGVNGSKGNTGQLERVSGHAVIGHQHTPAVYHGLIVVGTNTKLRLPYNERSPSTWLHANAVIWPDGSAQLLIMPEQRSCKWTFTA